MAVQSPNASQLLEDFLVLDVSLASPLGRSPRRNRARVFPLHLLRVGSC